LKENGCVGYLVGNKISLADIGLLEVLFWIEQLLSDELKPFVEIQVIKSDYTKNKFLNFFFFNLIETYAKIEE
jgi:hypothetical protein